MNILKRTVAVMSRAFLGAGLVVIMGCASTGEFGDRTAVVVYNQKPDHVMETTKRVFGARGYQVTSSDDTTTVFERPGTHYQNAAYGSWMSGKVWERATVSVEPYATGAMLLSADVELLQNKDDDFFREEKKMSKRARKPFQEMLDEVALILSQTPPPTDDE